MAKREVVNLGSGGNLPLSPGVKFGNLFFTSGQVGVDRESGTTPESVAEQTRNCFKNLMKILDAAGLGLEDVIKVNVYITDSAYFSEMNEAYVEFFPSDPPARTTVGIGGLARPEFKVEIEMIAGIEE
ncbi:MAG: RidA family protein [Clostridia bacterium]